MLALRHLRSSVTLRVTPHQKRLLNLCKPFSSLKNGDDEWNDAWESSWLPKDMQAKNQAPWETDVNFSVPTVILPSDVDSETKAFVQEMDENWNQRRDARKSSNSGSVKPATDSADLASMTDVEKMKRDYRMKKQRVHAALWMKEIEKEEEARLGTVGGAGNDIEKLLDSCSDIHTILPNRCSILSPYNGSFIQVVMKSVDQRFQAHLSSKLSLTGGKQPLRPRMGISGRCHRERKIFFFKNLSDESHSANSRLQAS